MNIEYTRKEGENLIHWILPFGQLRLFLLLRKVDLGISCINSLEGIPYARGFESLPLKFHSILLSNGKRWDTINGWNQGLRHRYLVWRARRWSAKVRKLSRRGRS